MSTPTCRATVRDRETKQLRGCKKQGNPLCSDHADKSSPCHMTGCENFGPITIKAGQNMDISFCWMHPPSAIENQTDHGNCLEIVVYQSDGDHISTTFMMEDTCMQPSCTNLEEHEGFCGNHYHRQAGALDRACGIIETLMVNIKNRDIRDLQFEEADKKRAAGISSSLDQRMDALIKKHLSHSPAEFIQQLRSHSRCGGGGGGQGGL